ncbi:MAG TPA: RNA polymerase sigma factor [Ignavibacteriaceae bacterium]|nr:RNA polymerase sigma factor [Ignavibacteriaceae bacterium]
MTSSKSDSELVNDFLNGDEKAFNMLALRYQEKIYWHARRMTGNHLDADDIVQQVLLVIYNKLKSFNFQSSLYTWIFKITSTRSLNFIKSKKIKNIISFEQTGELINSSDNDIIAGIDSRDKIERVQSLLKNIPTRQRQVFVLRNFDEMSYEEISKITGKSIGALKSSYFHAFNKLKELMKNYE